jgi:predicted transcriptional regulator
MNQAPVKKSMKDYLSSAAASFASENGYNISLVEGFVNETSNMIDALGEAKYMEFIKKVYESAFGIQDQAEPGQDAEDQDPGEPPVQMNGRLKEEIRAIIREEIKKAGTPEATQKSENAAGHPADETAPRVKTGGAEEKVKADEAQSKAATDETPSTAAADEAQPVDMNIKKASAKMKSYCEKVSAKICEDLSTIAGEKLKFTLKPVEIKRYPEVVSSTSEKCIFIEGLREDGSRMLARVSAKGAVRISGIMTMVPENILDEKVKTLNIGSSDVDAMKEIFNQIIGSMNKVNESDKMKLNNIIIMDNAKELEYMKNEADLLTVSSTWSMGNGNTNDFIMCIPVKDAAKLA